MRIKLRFKFDFCIFRGWWFDFRFHFNSLWASDHWILIIWISSRLENQTPWIDTPGLNNDFCTQKSQFQNQTQVQTWCLLRRWMIWLVSPFLWSLASDRWILINPNFFDQKSKTRDLTPGLSSRLLHFYRVNLRFQQRVKLDVYFRVNISISKSILIDFGLRSLNNTDWCDSTLF